MDEIFSNIYNLSVWGPGSGPGSAIDNIADYIAILHKFIKYNNITSIADIGCGMGYLPNYIDLDDIIYTGYDCVLDIISINIDKFPKQIFRHIDITTDKIVDRVDLVIIKDVCQHLSFIMIDKLLKNIPDSKYVIIIDDIGYNNDDTQNGGYRPINSNNYPFIGSTIINTYCYNINNIAFKKHILLYIN